MKTAALDPRSERSNASAKALLELLRAVTLMPRQYLDNDKLVEALRSQGALTKYADKGAGVVPTSLNTLKRAADGFLIGGWQQFDQMRVSALEAIENCRIETAPTKSTKTSVTEALVSTRAELESLRRVNLVLLRTVSQALHDFKLIESLKNDFARKRFVDEAIERARSNLVSNPPPFDRPESSAPTVVKLHAK